MSVRESLDPKSSLWDWIAVDLWFYRTKRKLSLAQVAQIMGCTRGTVSNIEAGRLKLNDQQAAALDQEWDTGGHFERLLYYARTGHDPDWFKQYTQYEAEASVIRIYQGQVIPNPFQTEEYARALLMASRSRDVEGVLRVRMEIQDALLARSEPPELWVLIDEGVLYHLIGDKAVMAAQLERLIELGKLPNVSVRVIPRSAGAHVGLDGPFRISSIGTRDVAYVGAQRGGRLMEGAAEVRELCIDYDRLGNKASSEDASRDLISKVLETYR